MTASNGMLMLTCNYKGLKVYILLDIMQHHWVTGFNFEIIMLSLNVCNSSSQKRNLSNTVSKT